VRYTEFTELEADLARGRIDFASSMARTPEREGRFAFSVPYTAFAIGLLARVDTPSGALSPDLAGRSVAVVPGFASQWQADRLFPFASRVVVRDVGAAIEAVRSGRADVLIESYPVLRDALARQAFEELAIVRRFEGPTSRLHFGFHPSQAAVAQRFSERIAARDPLDIAALVAGWTARPPRDTGPGRGTLTTADRDAVRGFAPVVAVVGDDPPFASVGPEGEPRGLSVGMLRAVFEALGVVPARWEAVTPQQLSRRLAAGGVDIVLGVDEAVERSAALRFVGPFIEYPAVIVGRPDGSAYDLHQLHGRDLALPPGSPARPLVESRHPGITVTDCPDTPGCIDAVRRGDADATVLDVISAVVAMARRPSAQVQIIGSEPLLRRSHSIAFAERHAALVPAFKRALDAAMPIHLDALKRQWLERPLREEAARAAIARLAPFAILAALVVLLAWFWHWQRLQGEIERTRQAQRRAEAAEATRRRFTAFLAHEVRNSLHAVLAGTELLRSAPRAAASPSVPDALPFSAPSVPDALPLSAPSVPDALVLSARGTLELLDNLLDRERLDAGRLVLRLRPAALAALVQAVCAELRPAAALAGFTVGSRVPAGGEALLVDALRVQQVLRNLLSNAIKHGGGAVEVALHVEAGAVPERRRVRLVVADRGPGFDAAARRALFQRYAGEGAPGSTGLGLELARDLALLMGGTLALLQRDGGGAEAVLEFEADLAPAEAAPGGAPKSVLLAEDAEVLALIAERALAQRGHAVVRVATGAEALVRLAAPGARFDLLLADLNLADGPAVAWLGEAVASGVPVVVMSADVAAEAEARLLAAGVRGVLEKGADIPRLVETALALAHTPGLTGASRPASASAPAGGPGVPGV
jgi:signal transduction histidine kinase/ActR/RegA family two-component response regulator